ncbi:hypothetical protein BLNAU_13756 [Blattamonas nauphoetae]|uniref:Uncharacterized protein n=1 Tax=Blattamonas nauphoetae TaxID=2049346 RepID=A0ABQ9XII6_9EUKA|nr:hypothetical protein BLNAU_13756 [Blattamonas nauphoetae]
MQTIDTLFHPTTSPALVLPLFALPTVLLLEHNPHLDLSTFQRRQQFPLSYPVPTPNRALPQLTDTVDEWTRLLVEEGLDDVVVFLTSDLMVPLSQAMGLNISPDSRITFPQELDRRG